MCEQNITEAETAAKPEVECLDRTEVFNEIQKFNNVKREGIVQVLLETMHRKGISLYEPVKYTQVIAMIRTLGREKTLHMIFYKYLDKCLDELWDMRDEGMLGIEILKGGRVEYTIVPGTLLAEVVGKFIKE
jgi:hypothetical protein